MRGLPREVGKSFFIILLFYYFLFSISKFIYLFIIIIIILTICIIIFICLFVYLFLGHYCNAPLGLIYIKSKYLIAWRYIYMKLLPRAHAMEP